MPDPKQGLELELKDFLNPRRVEDYEKMTHRIFISSTTLHDILLETRTVGNESGARSTLASGVKKWKRQRTPPQEIASGDEKQYTTEDKEAEARSESQDESDHQLSFDD